MTPRDTFRKQSSQINIELSIIVPVFNVEQYLSKCLDSILQQDYDDYEIICINDGSTDNSQYILDKYSRKDSRIRVIEQRNSGLSQARNTGLDVAKGRYVMFIDSDDYLRDGSLKRMVQQMRPGIDAVVTTCKVVYYENKELKKEDERFFKIPFDGVVELEPELLFDFHCCAWAKIFRMDIIRRNSLRFPVGRKYEDNYWHWCYGLVSKRFYFKNEFSYYYIRRPGSIMNETFKKKQGWSIDNLYILDEILTFAERKNKILNADIQKKLFYHYFMQAQYGASNVDLPLIYWKASKVLQNHNLGHLDSYMKKIQEGNWEIRLVGSEREVHRNGNIKFIDVKRYFKAKLKLLFKLKKVSSPDIPRD